MKLRLFYWILALLATVSALSTGAALAATSKEKPRSERPGELHVQGSNTLKAIRFYRGKAWYWQRSLGRSLSKSSDFRKIKGVGYRRWAADMWAGRAAQLRAEFYRLRTAQLRSLMSLPPAPPVRTPQASGLFQKRQMARLWEQRAKTVYRQAQNPPHKPEWLCIHRYEGAWNDPNSPYYGGLQMDLEFQRTYGAELLRKKGTADNWTPIEQMWVAERAHSSGRGFYPWPNTAHHCGLI